MKTSTLTTAKVPSFANPKAIAASVLLACATFSSAQAEIRDAEKQHPQVPVKTESKGSAVLFFAEFFGVVGGILAIVKWSGIREHHLKDAGMEDFEAAIKKNPRNIPRL